MNNLKVSVIMVTFRKDIDFACYSFQSIAKFATGFHEVVVVVPNPDVALFQAASVCCNARVIGFDERAGKGMLHHQVKILEADLICPEADAILHMDADCLFTAPVSPGDYFTGERPIIFRQKYESFRHADSRYSWKACVRNATGIDPEWETMCRHPSVYLREIYGLTRDTILQHVQMDWAEYILSCKNTYPQTFAEFPTLGAVAIQFTEDRYSWVEVEKVAEGYRITPEQPEPKMVSCWSHGGIEMINDRHPGLTARQFMEKILA